MTSPSTLPRKLILGPAPDQWWAQVRHWGDGQTDFDVEDEEGNTLPYRVEWETSSTGSIYFTLIREDD